MSGDDLIIKGMEIFLCPNEDTENTFNQNMGHVRFLWNKLIESQEQMYALFKETNDCPYPNYTTFIRYLNILKEAYSFLRDCESSALQQVCRDLARAYNKFLKEKRGHPKFKSKKTPKKSYRMQQQSSKNIKIDAKTLKLPKIPEKIKYKTSKEYRAILQKSKINNLTIKYHNGKYYGVFNVELNIHALSKTHKNIGIDLGMKTLATLSTGKKITNLNLSYEESMIKKYQKQMSRRKKGSKRYQKSQKKYWKWIDRKNNKKKDTYHKFTYNLVKKFDLICMEDLNIEGMRKNGKWASKLQRITWGQILQMIKYKTQWYGKKLIQADRFFPSSQICHKCGYQHTELKINERKWECPHCHTVHDRDVNASINLLNYGL